MKPLVDARLKITGVVVVLLLLGSILIIASPWSNALWCGALFVQVFAAQAVIGHVIHAKEETATCHSA